MTFKEFNNTKVIKKLLNGEEIPEFQKLLTFAKSELTRTDGSKLSSMKISHYKQIAFISKLKEFKDHISTGDYSKKRFKKLSSFIETHCKKTHKFKLAFDRIVKFRTAVKPVARKIVKKSKPTIVTVEEILLIEHKPQQQLLIEHKPTPAPFRLDMISDYIKFRVVKKVVLAKKTQKPVTKSKSVAVERGDSIQLKLNLSFKAKPVVKSKRIEAIQLFRNVREYLKGKEDLDFQSLTYKYDELSKDGLEGSIRKVIKPLYEKKYRSKTNDLYKESLSTLQELLDSSYVLDVDCDKKIAYLPILLGTAKFELGNARKNGVARRDALSYVTYIEEERDERFKKIDASADELKEFKKTDLALIVKELFIYTRAEIVRISNTMNNNDSNNIYFKNCGFQELLPITGEIQTDGIKNAEIDFNDYERFNKIISRTVKTNLNDLLLQIETDDKGLADYLDSIPSSNIFLEKIEYLSDLSFIGSDVEENKRVVNTLSDLRFEKTSSEEEDFLKTMAVNYYEKCLQVNKNEIDRAYKLHHKRELRFELQSFVGKLVYLLKHERTELMLEAINVKFGDSDKFRDKCRDMDNYRQHHAEMNTIYNSKKMPFYGMLNIKDEAIALKQPLLIKVANSILKDLTENRVAFVKVYKNSLINSLSSKYGTSFDKEFLVTKSKVLFAINNSKVLKSEVRKILKDKGKITKKVNPKLYRELYKKELNPKNAVLKSTYFVLASMTENN